MVYREEAIEDGNGAGGPENVTIGLDLNLGDIEHGRFHLRGHEAFPDELV